MGSARAGKGMGNQKSAGQSTAGADDQSLPGKSGMGQQVQGDDRLLGNDEIRAHNERRGVPGETTRTQGVVESFELMDPKKRAEHMKRKGR
jgi:hypothetical protein